MAGIKLVFDGGAGLVFEAGLVWDAAGLGFEIALGFDDEAVFVSDAAVLDFDVEAALVSDTPLVPDDEVELCLGIAVELVLEDEDSVGRMEVELDGLMVPEDLVTLDEWVLGTLEDLVVLGKLVIPDGMLVLEWVAPDEVVVLGVPVTTGGLVMAGELVTMGELVATGELVTTALERDDETIG